MVIGCRPEYRPKLVSSIFWPAHKSNNSISVSVSGAGAAVVRRMSVAARRRPAAAAAMVTGGGAVASS